MATERERERRETDRERVIKMIKMGPLRERAKQWERERDSERGRVRGIKMIKMGAMRESETVQLNECTGWW